MMSLSVESKKVKIISKNKNVITRTHKGGENKEVLVKDHKLVFSYKFYSILTLHILYLDWHI